MELTGNTVLITGGGSGLGLGMADALLQRKNTVIIVGRNAKKLEEAAATRPGLHTRVCDVTSEKSLRELVQDVVRGFPAFNMLINNAGVMNNWDLCAGDDGMDALEGEVATNFLAPVRLTALCIAHLRRRPQATVVNVSSGVAYFPIADAPIYCATKAALHSFTIALRHQLKDTPIKVIELVPPSVESPMSAGRGLEKAGGLITTEAFVRAAMAGLASDTEEIRVGMTRMLYAMTRIAPSILRRQMLGTRSARAQ